MLVQLLSDLHFEDAYDRGFAFANREVLQVADTLVLAGDVMNLQNNKRVIETMRWFCDRFKDVIYVPGNHEYYYTTPAEANARLVKAAEEISNLHVLNPGVAEVGGQRFVGATMWFPRPEAEARKWIDFNAIHDPLPWIYEEHARQMEHLRQNVRPSDVVVTHHLPHSNSTPAKFAKSPNNCFFVAPDAAEILALSPKLWMHGHTHNSFSYEIGKTKVVCNPRGHGHENPRFDSAYVVEV